MQEKLCDSPINLLKRENFDEVSHENENMLISQLYFSVAK
jgi:hypothetical protein